MYASKKHLDNEPYIIRNGILKQRSNILNSRVIILRQGLKTGLKKKALKMNLKKEDQLQKMEVNMIPLN
jgi:hypothetical protein